VTETNRPKTKKAERYEATRAALVSAARTLFAERGFAGTGTQEIVEAAGVTRGALYHHFRDKEALFLAVFESIESELADQLHRAGLRVEDPLDRLQLGFAAFLNACLEPDVQRIGLIDGPAVLGWDQWHEIDSRYWSGTIEDALQEAVDAKLIDSQPTAPLAQLLLGAASQAALLLAKHPQPRRGRAETAESFRRLLDGLRTKRRRR
jgi:AcrR family transcriptional regulator